MSNYSVVGFNQGYFIEYMEKFNKENPDIKINLDPYCLIILRLVIDIYPITEKKIIGDKEYGLINYTKIQEYIPIFDLSKKVIYDRIKVLEVLNLISKELVKTKTGTDMYYRLTENTPNALFGFNYFVNIQQPEQPTTTQPQPKQTKKQANYEKWEECFEQIYAAYPRKVSKIQAKTTFEHKIRGLNQDEVREVWQKVLNAESEFIKYWKQAKTEVKFIPHLSTWLNSNFENSKYFK